MMAIEAIEQLRQQYTDQYVVVASDRAELARFRGAVGQVKTINCNGRALVQFDLNNDLAWHDIQPGDLKIVDKPEPKPVVEKKPCSGKDAAKPAATKPNAGPPSSETPSA
jgi:hypothetical protein